MGAIAAAVAGSVASSATSSLFSKKNKNGGSTQAKAFTPSNLYTPSGSATWNGGNGTATLSPELQAFKDTYKSDAGGYHSALSQFLGPSKSDFYKTNAGYTPKSYDDYYKQFAPQYTTTNTQGAPDSRYLQNYGFSGKVGNAGTPSTTTNVNQQGLDSAIKDAMSRDQQANTTFDQAGYDTASAGFKDPSQVMYDKLRALSKPGEDQARTELESRLSAQGLLGQSNGQGYNPNIKAFDDSAHQADQERELTALTSTPDLMSKYQKLFDNSVNGVTSLNQIPTELLKTGANIGVGAGSNSIGAANSNANINANSSDFWGRAGMGIGDKVGNAVTDYFKTKNSGGGTSNSVFSANSNNNSGINYGGGNSVFDKYNIGGSL